MKAGLVVLGVGALLAGVALAGWLTSDAVLDQEILSLDPSRANLRSADGGSGYRIDLGHLRAGDRVDVRFEFRDNRNGSASVHARHAVDGDVAPPPSEGLAHARGNVGDVNFTAPADGEYALAVESSDGAPKGKVRVDWEPPQHSGRNPVFLGAARAVLTLTVPLAVLLMAASWWRGRHPSR